MPHVRNAEHIALVSHGLYIDALVAALLKRDSSGIAPTREYTGMKNTAWARVVIKVQACRALRMGHQYISLTKTLPLWSYLIVTDFSHADHLVSLNSNTCGTGKIAYDQRQREIRVSFSGTTKAVATEHCESNVLDGVDGKAKN
ncbi:uncharacterized protein EDB91DRAFT_1336202 [Suillus paluster]|uniref:uncharacterized protein n=1 Tax=Suillus paluster TaxID=48578 RepID=UPI001B868FE0|nr:uncharacterized protein EDB91DRAFT_1336202 [Suillus paluster]KAG1741820.1 hypothetical protein EDB91DRAFT_1336202 [Suillus paluster]